MKYPYRVIHNGVLYMAGEEVPDNETVVEEEVKTVETEVKEETPETVVEEIKEESTFEPAEEEPKKVFKPTPKYGRNQINRMAVSDLRDVAVEVGIKNIQSKTGAELKREIIEILGVQELKNVLHNLARNKDQA